MSSEIAGKRLSQIVFESLLLIIFEEKVHFAFSSEEFPMRDIALLLAILLISVLMGVVYALPTIIADYRNDRHLITIWVLNFFGGWTVVGWTAALIWSLTDNVREAAILQRAGSIDEVRSTVQRRVPAGAIGHSWLSPWLR